MKTDIPKEFKKFVKHCHCLKRILKDTKNFLDEFNNNLHIDGEHKIEFTIQDDLSQIEHKLERTPTLIIFGQNCHAKALFVNSFLDQNILPLFSANWRFITFMYGNAKNIRLTLGQEIEILEKLKAHETSWNTIPEEDIQESDQECPLDQWPSLEVELPHPVLRDNIVAMVPPDVSHPDQLPIILKNHMENVLPVIIYAVCDDVLTENNIQEIKKLKDLYQTPFLFVSVTNSEKAGVLGTESLTESEQHLVETGGQDSIVKLENLRDQLRRLGYLHGSDKTADGIMRRKSFCLEFSMDNAMCDTKINEELILFIREILKSSVLKMAASLSEVHNRYLRGFILSAFDMAREIQITPKRIKYSQEIEAKLYESLMKIASDQQDHISRIIERTLQDMKSNVAEVLEGHTSLDTQSPKMATMEIQQLVLQRLSNSVATQIVQSVGCLQESFTGTLQRCLESLEKNNHDGHEGNLSASDAVKQIVTAAYNIDLKSFSTFSVIHNLMDRLRKLLTSTWTSSHPVQCDFQWQLQVVSKIINSLSEEKLTKAISSQFQESVRSSHESFQAAIRSLESQLSGKLEHTEDQRITIRKKHAPRFARLALESTSLCDQIRWGMPKPIKEIGRGQYGVVSSCEEWGGIKPCAFKSVVPPDDRHWSDLAMEFYYTRTLPEDCRIVKLRGSIIDYTYGGGTTAVLLIMERMTRDLYCGLKNGLSWTSRVRIAIDVVEGIRYLHSQGLVHRDIKLKNVLLDNHDRAKLTDFGFCIPEAMMSGSVVGTPVHMAPELLSGRYDSSVDVYAFGILFWYICAGQTSLPNEFNKFHNKEQLWNNVRKGTRPECLKHFNPKCWNLMEQCWDAEPANRPLLGYVQPQLELIYKQAKQESSSRSFAGNDTKYSSDIDFSYNLMSVREY